VTRSGLTELHLSDVIKHKMLELEKQRDENILATAQDEKILHETMDQILSLLFNSKGNILDNQQLIETLQNAKQT
jgi:dynein heavy chain